MAMDWIEIKPSEIGGSKLHRFLAAHLALERAAARRRLFVHLSALFAVPVWVVSIVFRFHEFKPIALGLFAGPASGALLSLIHELRCKGAVRSLENEVKEEVNEG